MGGIFGDEEELEEEEEDEEEETEEEETDEEEEDEDEEESESPILDLTAAQREKAQKKLNSGEMLFPEERAEAKKLVKRSKKDRADRPARILGPVSQDILDEVGDAIGEFDAETANKKMIRTLRKALQHLSLARYPKKKKDKSERLAKLKASKKVAPAAKKVVKKLIKGKRK